MSRMGELWIKKLNEEEDERLATLKKQEQAEDYTMEYKQLDPRGGRDKQIVNAPVHCVQCGEVVQKIVFCSEECRANYDKEVGGWLDGIEELLPSNRDKQ